MSRKTHVQSFMYPTLPWVCGGLKTGRKKKTKKNRSYPFQNETTTHAPARWVRVYWEQLPAHGRWRPAWLPSVWPHRLPVSSAQPPCKYAVPFIQVFTTLGYTGKHLAPFTQPLMTGTLFRPTYTTFDYTRKHLASFTQHSVIGKLFIQHYSSWPMFRSLCLHTTFSHTGQHLAPFTHSFATIANITLSGAFVCSGISVCCCDLLIQHEVIFSPSTF